MQREIAGRHRLQEKLSRDKITKRGREPTWSRLQLGLESAAVLEGNGSRGESDGVALLDLNSCR